MKSEEFLLVRAAVCFRAYMLKSYYLRNVRIFFTVGAEREQVILISRASVSQESLQNFPEPTVSPVYTFSQPSAVRA